MMMMQCVCVCIGAGDLSPFDFFRQEANNQDAVVRTDAMKMVGIVSALMGPEKTRSDMVAFLQTKMEDLDQVLLVMAEKLEKFLPLVGGPEHAHALIPLFEPLCDIEEVTVRDAAANSCAKILKQLGPQHKNQIISYFEFFKRLSNEESGEVFYSRVSSCRMVTELYVLLNDADKAILREIYGRLCRDELPIVRRGGALVFQNFSKLVDTELLTNEFLTLLKTFLADESQTVQVIGVENLASYSALLKKGNATSILTADILPMVKSYADDHSWRIRQALVKGFGQFASVFLAAEVSTDVLPSLGHLALDPEPDVRTLAVQEFVPFLDVVGSVQFISEFAPVAQQLVEDPVNQVRKLLSELCVDILGKVEPEIVSAHLSDLIIKFMNDEDPLVRLRIIKKLDIIAKEAESLCTRLTENLKSMFNHSNWRLRKGLVEAMPSVVQHMGQDYFVDHFLNHSLLLVKDGVEEVRIAACEALAKIASITEIAWVYDRIFPTFKSLANEDYLTRLTMMTALERFLALEQVQDRFQSECVAQIVAMSTDKVPNVRLRAAQALHFALRAANETNHLGLLKEQMLSALNDLQNDKDKDVRYFATHAKSA